MATPPRNALTRPAESDQTRWAAPPDPATGRLPANALMIPRAPAAVGLPPPPAAPAGVEISPRVPVPAGDFDPNDHPGLHHKTMGEAFDDPEAQNFVRHLYRIVRKSHPDVHPKHVLETARDAYHAVHFGLLHPYIAGLTVGTHARRRHRQAEESRRANIVTNSGGRSAATESPSYTRPPTITAAAQTRAQPAAAIPGRTTAA